MGKMETDDRQAALPVKSVWALPADGVADDALLKQMEGWKAQDEARWKHGQASGAVYHGGEEHMAVLNRAAGLFSVSNPLHADLWPSVVKMEAEIVAITAGLVGGGDAGDPGVCGTMTSGGTESIFLSIKAHREQAERERGISAPELVCCNTCHAAVDKACSILRIRVISLPPTHTFEADCTSMERHINSNTIMMYASAPSYAHGIMDPVEKLGLIAKRHGIGLHVDACLGGFFLPFARRLRPGAIPSFDFSVEGVTAMSCDTHKYGYAVKGTSVALFRSRKLRHHSYFATPDWTGGIYITATTAGSRPGGPSAATWASLMRLGDSGFMDATRKILEAAEHFAQGIRKIQGIHVLGSPVAMMVAVGSQELDIHAVGRKVKKRIGVGLSSCQNPPCIHLCTTLRHVGHVDALLAALEASVADVRAAGAKQASGADVYGVTDGSASKPASGSKTEALFGYVDSVLDMPKRASKL